MLMILKPRNLAWGDRSGTEGGGEAMMVKTEGGEKRIWWCGLREGDAMMFGAEGGGECIMVKTEGGKKRIWWWGLREGRCHDVWGLREGESAWWWRLRAGRTGCDAGDWGRWREHNGEEWGLKEKAMRLGEKLWWGM
jgi:hypothetical protein